MPYDSGIAIVADAAAHRAAMGLSAAYLTAASETSRNNHEWTPEASRRARGFPLYAALRSLGRSGVADLVDRCCDLAVRMANRLSDAAGVEILNDVVLNQVLVAITTGDGRDVADAVIDRVQRDGTCWVGGTAWHGRRAMRISISNWSTTEADIDRSAESILAAARVGIITGSGTYALPDFADPEPHDLDTPFGATLVTEGLWAEQTVLHVSRHGEGHARLSNHVNHRANVWALRELGADCVVACTACGALHPEQPLGGLIVFDELHFLGNRLADGSLCTLFTKPGDSQRGHWIIGPPYSESLREALVAAAAEASVPARDGGCYGHVDGPRFNTRTEIAALRGVGVTAVSQTGGPETVLCGEAELPYALMGYASPRRPRSTS